MVSRLRRPEYTGENRCLPCTVVNLALAAVASIGVGAVAWSAASPIAGVAAAAVVLASSTASIYLRGYLVPGTPELTKRYLPHWVLSRFGKEPDPAVGTDGGRPPQEPATQLPSEDFNPETVLLEAGALEEDPDHPDLRLASDFRTAWYDAVDRIDDTGDYDAIFAILEVEDGDVELTETEAGKVRVDVDGGFVGVWPSRAALLADLGGAAALADEYADWSDLGGHRRGELLGGLRLFVDRCPTCGATPEFGEETVETCCTSRGMAVVECPDCGARLFEAAADQPG